MPIHMGIVRNAAALVMFAFAFALVACREPAAPAAAAAAASAAPPPPPPLASLSSSSPKKKEPSIEELASPACAIRDPASRWIHVQLNAKGRLFARNFGWTKTSDLRLAAGDQGGTLHVTSSDVDLVGEVKLEEIVLHPRAVAERDGWFQIPSVQPTRIMANGDVVVKPFHVPANVRLVKSLPMTFPCAEVSMVDRPGPTGTLKYALLKPGTLKVRLTASTTSEVIAEINNTTTPDAFEAMLPVANTAKARVIERQGKDSGDASVSIGIGAASLVGWIDGAMIARTFNVEVPDNEPSSPASRDIGCSPEIPIYVRDKDGPQLRVGSYVSGARPPRIKRPMNGEIEGVTNDERIVDLGLGMGFDQNANARERELRPFIYASATSEGCVVNVEPRAP
jgi:hypothetical protein